MGTGRASFGRGYQRKRSVGDVSFLGFVRPSHVLWFQQRSRGLASHFSWVGPHVAVAISAGSGRSLWSDRIPRTCGKLGIYWELSVNDDCLRFKL